MCVNMASYNCTVNGGAEGFEWLLQMAGAIRCFTQIQQVIKPNGEPT